MTATNFHISIAPMLDWTDRHCRYFHRLISPHVRLYTEMVTCGALIHGDADRHLRFNAQEHPLVLQLGGSDPAELAACAAMGERYGYDEINLNCGCPSPRVQKGAFGACLMEEPALVAACVQAMQDAISIPVSVKCRIGINDVEEAPFLERFVRTVSDTGGCTRFDIHARKAWLEGLSPKENREVPPLRPDLVRAIKADFPHLSITLNGGVGTLDAIQSARQDGVDGVMIGRRAYQDPYFLADIERTLYGHTSLPREDIVRAMIPYIRQQEQDFGVRVHSVTRHMTGLFHDVPGAKAWRQILSTAHRDDTQADILNAALDAVHKHAPSGVAA